MAYWQTDSRIEDGTPLRDLEKKVHFLMQLLATNGIITDGGNNNSTLDPTIAADYTEISNSD
jgi:hypothetical protein